MQSEFDHNYNLRWVLLLFICTRLGLIIMIILLKAKQSQASDTDDSVIDKAWTLVITGPMTRQFLIDSQLIPLCLPIIVWSLSLTIPPSIPYCILASFHCAKYLVTGWDAYLGQAHLWFTSKWDIFTIIQHDQNSGGWGWSEYGRTLFKCKIIGYGYWTSFCWKHANIRLNSN